MGNRIPPSVEVFELGLPSQIHPMVILNFVPPHALFGENRWWRYSRTCYVWTVRPPIRGSHRRPRSPRVTIALGEFHNGEAISHFSVTRRHLARMSAANDRRIGIASRALTLEDQGLAGFGPQYWNLPQAVLVEHALARARDSSRTKAPSLFRPGNTRAVHHVINSWFANQPARAMSTGAR